MEKSVLRYGIDNLIQGTSLVNQHSDFTEYTRYQDDKYSVESGKVVEALAELMDREYSK